MEQSEPSSAPTLSHQWEPAAECGPRSEAAACPEIDRRTKESGMRPSFAGRPGPIATVLDTRKGTHIPNPTIRLGSAYPPPTRSKDPKIRTANSAGRHWEGIQTLPHGASAGRRTPDRTHL